MQRVLLGHVTGTSSRASRRQVGEVVFVARVASGVAGLVAALAGVRALAVAPRWPQQGVQGRGLLQRRTSWTLDGVTEQGRTRLVRGRGADGRLLHPLRKENAEEGGLTRITSSLLLNRYKIITFLNCSPRLFY